MPAFIGARRYAYCSRRGYSPLIALGTDLLAWWDADPATWGSKGGVTVATGVSSWRENVAGYAATQGTGSLQPVWSASSFNGGAGVSYDGTDDVLTCTDATLLAALPIGANPAEMWLLGQQDALVGDTSTRYAFSYGGSNGGTWRGMSRVVSTGVNRCQGDPGDTDGTVNFSTRHVVRFQIGATATDIAVDGNSPAHLNVVPATATSARVRLGSRNSTSAALFWQGQIAAALITMPLSASKAATLQTYLLNRRRL